MRVLVALTLASVAVACQDARSSPRPSPAPKVAPAPARAVPAVTPPQLPSPPTVADQARLEPVGCAGVFVAGAATVPADLAAGSGAVCHRRPAHQPAQIYDDCRDASWTSTGCAIPYGQQFCHAGTWTVVCRADADCPTAMRCTTDESVGAIDVAAAGYGACALRCTSDAACGRCDLYCDRDDGVCRSRVADEEEEGPDEGDERDERGERGERGERD